MRIVAVSRYCDAIGLFHSSLKSETEREVRIFSSSVLTSFCFMAFISCSFVTVFNGPTTSHKVGKLQERTEYQFRIQASNDAGPGPFSDVVSFVTTAQPPNTVKG